MSAAPVFPQSRYEPAPLIDLSRKPERERLSGPAARAFFNIGERWKLRDEDARQLLAMSNGPYYQLKKAPDSKTLDADRLTRISCLIGIFKALNILHGETLADEWVRLPNRNRIFGGEPPLDIMIRGGLPAMLTVRRLLDARRGGSA
ncbi:antitoxin Xre/MbcA/ParS toxin-binding domain-containing protein [Algiphilus sp. W345]|uniref:Antitoxin Xre/MbcA/ParS toxin-binding domain-containing protein n=1 Tax=Banduia mediterranea TaxID=3075609 RepID=A0ABU2WJU4_9GAMM|nr:antitoxin Xre/MbcA/ParS toxin-binding domain-containing protein [Algiphilus sp. W345]MDT0498140.1 antitoxin Xre/MbcA/ParS toxin-binding domain-containing protein [Algiphilus sp. W345]